MEGFNYMCEQLFGVSCRAVRLAGGALRVVQQAARGARSGRGGSQRDRGRAAGEGWAEGVQKLELTDSEEGLLGSIYLDLQPRCAPLPPRSAQRHVAWPLFGAYKHPKLSIVQADQGFWGGSLHAALWAAAAGGPVPAPFGGACVQFWRQHPEPSSSRFDLWNILQVMRCEMAASAANI